MVMASAPRVSIGLPVYNGATFLSAALDSLTGQEFDDFELIISDNASSDRTEEICRDYASRDPRIRYSRNDFNLGPLRNFWRTFELASGEYFMWAAHDDLWSASYVRRMVAGLDAWPRAILVAGQIAYITQRGEPAPVPPVAAPPDHPVPPRELVGPLFGQQASTWFYGMYRRAELAELMELLGSLPVWGGDMLFLTRCCLNYQVVGDNEAVIYKRLRDDSLHFPKTPRAWVHWQTTFTARLLAEVITARQPWREKWAVLVQIQPHFGRLVFKHGAMRTAFLWLRAAFQLSQLRDHA